MEQTARPMPTEDPRWPVERKLAVPAPLGPQPKADELTLNRSRDDLLTAFGLQTLKDRYLLLGEGPQDMCARVACAFADDHDHAQRLYDAMSQLWFMPANPFLSNGGTTRGLPISCFLNSVPDSLAAGSATTISAGCAHLPI